MKYVFISCKKCGNQNSPVLEFPENNFFYRCSICGHEEYNVDLVELDDRDFL